MRYSDEPMRDYQRFAANWLLDRIYARSEKGAGLFLDPGLGKTRTTLTAIDTLLTVGEIKKALVIAPLRPLYNVWPNEIMKWGFDMSFITLHGQHTQAMREDCQVELVNPEGLPKLRAIKNRWDLVVVDESTKFKTWGTKTRARPLRTMLKTIPKRIILTGTPAPNSLKDLHSQMYIVDDGDALGRTKTYFDQMFMYKGGWQGREWLMRDGMRDELLDRIKDKVLRMQAEDYLDMPELTVNDIWCSMPSRCEAEYRRLKRDLYAELESGSIFASTAGSAYSKCRQFANGTVYNTDELGERTSVKAHDEKISALADLSEELCGKPLLVGYQFTQDLHRLLANPAFKKSPFIKGGMKERDVKLIVDDWNDGKIRTLFCQTDSVSHGMNMQEACNDVAMFGLTDKPEVYEQFFRRVYRLGVQGSHVRIHRLLTKDTVDEIMIERLNGKFQTQHEFLEHLKNHARS